MKQLLGRGKQCAAEVTIYSAQVPPDGFADEQATLFPIHSFGNKPSPEATTVPLPSSPGIKEIRSSG